MTTRKKSGEVKTPAISSTEMKRDSLAGVQLKPAVAGMEEQIVPRWTRSLEALMLADSTMESYACIVSNNEHKVFQEIDIPEEAVNALVIKAQLQEQQRQSGNVDEKDMIRATLRADALKSSYEKRNHDMLKKQMEYTDKYRVAFAFIWATISPESQATLEEQPTFGAILARRDPLELYRLAIKTHIGDAAGRSPNEVKVLAIKVLNDMVMKPREMVSDYKQRFQRQLEILSAVGCEPPNKELIDGRWGGTYCIPAQDCAPADGTSRLRNGVCYYQCRYCSTLADKDEDEESCLLRRCV